MQLIFLYSPCTHIFWFGLLSLFFKLGTHCVITLLWTAYLSHVWKPVSLLFQVPCFYLFIFITVNLFSLCGYMIFSVTKYLLSECSIMADTLWSHGLTVAFQPLLSMKFSQQEYWSGLPPGYLPSPPRDRTYVSCVSCIGRQLLCDWATWEALQISTCTLS